MKNVLRMSVLLLATISLFIFSWKSQAQSSVQYENRRQIQGEIYYNEVTVEPMNITNSNESMYVVSERTIAGFGSDINLATNTTVKVKTKKVKEEKTNRWSIELTKDEIDLLAKIVWTESRGESDEGQRGICEVIFNRMIYEKEFKGSLTDVLSQKIGGSSQFCSWKLRDKAKPTDKEYDNIKKVLNGETDILDFDTVYFSTSPRNSDIAKHIGGHYFCRYEFK